jgi:hypothetical protein
VLTRACGHVADASPVRVCPHLVAVAEDDGADLVGLLTGQALTYDVACTTCGKSDEPMSLTEICEGCADRLVEDNEITAWRGQPGILERPEPVDATVLRWPLPLQLDDLTDVAPVHDATVSTWLALTADGRIAELAPDADRVTVLANIEITSETDHTPFMGKVLRPRLLVSACGRFAAVVHDYGRYGQVVDLARGGVPTMTLDGGDYHSDTVPFSAAFAVVAGRPVLVHRTAWNRLDISDPQTGELLTGREHETVPDAAGRPPHYLDYFHGRLHVSPDSRAIADDGWVWAPAGMPRVWDLHAWLDGNVWESEDGPSKHTLCQRWYHWDVGMCFVGDTTVAVSGIGDDDIAMLPGVRMFSVTSGAQLTAFAGPAGTLLSDGLRLYSVHDGTTHVWDPVTGHRTATISDFAPTCLHRGTGELAAVAGGALLRWHTGRSA